MRTLSGTLETAMESSELEPRIKITFSLAGESDVVVEEDRILQIPSQEEASDSQTAEVICDNSDGFFTSLALQGWQAVLEWGLVASGDEYSAVAPMKVLSQNMSSLPGVLQCRFSLIGIPNRLAEDKASKDYFHHWSDTKTVKDMLTEIADGEPVAVELTEQQVTYDSWIDLKAQTFAGTVFAGVHGAGQRLGFSGTMNKLSFNLKKTGVPVAANVTFRVTNAETDALLGSKTFAVASITGGGGWCEVTFAAPLVIDLPLTFPGGVATGGIWIWVEDPDGTAAAYISVRYNSVAIKANEWMMVVGSVLGTTAFTDLECAYKYKYDDAGIDCWARGTGPETYCESYDVVYDPYGTHTSGTHATIMTDSAAAFKTDALIGQVIYNTTDGSSGIVTDNDATTVTVAALAGGGDDQWDTADTYTIEDALLDVYMPKDAYRIYEGQSRLDKINQLLHYTGCVKRVEADGKIHVFVPVTSGTVYDSEYSLAAGHTFFSKAIRNALVIPNRISVKSLKTDDTEYSGAATSATSFALLPVSDYMRTSLVSDAQGALMAAAMISRLEVAAQRGGAAVPMNLGAEVFDYVIVTDSRQSDTRTGNIGYIRRSYSPGTTWRMDFGFGGVALKGVPGTRPSLLQREPIPEPTLGEATLKWGMIKPSLEIIDDQLDWLYGRGEYEKELTGMKWVEAAIAELWGEKGLGSLVAVINQILSGLGWLEGEVPADEQIGTALLPYYTKTQADAAITAGSLQNVVEDLTPQLGGNLVCNGKDILGAGVVSAGAGPLWLTAGNVVHKFLADGNFDMEGEKIVELDDPTDNQDAATKKYVDDNAGMANAVEWTEPARSIDTTYTNSSGYSLVVVVTVNMPSADVAHLLQHASSDPPTTIIARCLNDTGSQVVGLLVGVIKNGYKYRVSDINGSPAILEWHEYALGKA